MSEPTADGKQQPDPEQQPEAAPGDTETAPGDTETAPGDRQDEPSGSVFNDPTAPVWVDPTSPIPAPPAPEAPSAWVQDTPEVPMVPPTPPGASSPYGQQPPAPQAAPPASNPYAQQPPAPQAVPPATNPYAQQPPAPPYAQQYPTYGQPYYATGAPSAPSNTSAIILTIVSGLATLTTCVIGIPSLIFGIMALSANSTDPVGSRQKSRTGWIIFAVNAGIVVLLAVAAIAIFVIGGTSSTSFDSGY